MAGILNKTARQFNLRCISKKGEHVVVYLAPGFNVVDDAHWDHLKNDPYVKGLKKDNLIDFGKKLDDMELETAPDTQSKSSVTQLPNSDKGKDDKDNKDDKDDKDKDKDDKGKKDKDDL